MSIKVETEKVGGGFFTLPAYKSTASEKGKEIATGWSKSFGSPAEARENLQDKLAELSANRR